MLTEIFGAYPQVKVIDLLLTHQNIEYTKEEIAECAEISGEMLDLFWEQLERYRIIQPTRKTGNAQLYTTNMDSKAMQALKRFQYELAEIEIEEQIGLVRREKEAIII
jgi:hypothetical protein